MTNLLQKRCKPCEGGVAPLAPDAAGELLQAIDEGWILSTDGKCISRRFEFPAYARTIAFANAIAWIATTEGHHPEMTVNYGSCLVAYTTHAIDGLSENDFICAAKVDRIFDEAAP